MNPNTLNFEKKRRLPTRNLIKKPRQKGSITHCEYEPKNTKLSKKKRRLPMRNLKNPNFLKVEVGFFSDIFFFADFPNIRTLISPELHLKNF